MANTEDTRKRIRSAAQALVAEQGAANLTLEAVAKDAGVSKGGLLYHYANKQALLEGMLEDLLLKRQTWFLSSQAKQGTGAQLQSLINTEFLLTVAERATRNAILAAGAENPALLDPARDYYRTLFSYLRKDSSDPELGIIVALALHGMQLLETIGLNQMTISQKDTLQHRLVELVS